MLMATDEQLQAILSDGNTPAPKCSWPRRLPTTGWNIAFSHPRQEKTAAASLRRKQFEAWFPTYKIMVLPPRDKVTSSKRNNLAALAKIEERPLYRSYVFFRPVEVEADVHRVFEMIRDQEPGLRGLMAVGASLAKVSHHDIAKLRKGQEEGLFDISNSARPFPYKVGEKVPLKQFFGHSALIERLDESGNAHLMAPMFGGEVRIVMSMDDLANAAAD